MNHLVIDCCTFTLLLNFSIFIPKHNGIWLLMTCSSLISLQACYIGWGTCTILKKGGCSNADRASKVTGHGTHSNSDLDGLEDICTMDHLVGKLHK